jgi:hypothetical protein
VIGRGLNTGARFSRPGAACLRAVAAVLAIFLTIYLPDIGRGFISDDFRWIVESRVTSFAEAAALFTTNIGFYRPVTSLSFAIDGALWGGSAFGYGVTNLLLCLAVAGAMFAVAREVGLAAPGALLAAAVWMLNFHAINMAVLWLSGRTALLAACFSLGAAWGMFRGWSVASGLLALAAMLSKEEAIALPALFTLHALIVQRRISLRTVVPLWMSLGVYLVLRLQSGAFWPGDAPSFYQFSFAPSVVGRNVLEYIDRSGTVFALVAAVLAAAAPVRWRDLSPGERRVLGFAALWIAGMYTLTVFLPLRSSLYALLPSLGSALALGVLAGAAHRRVPSRFAKVVIGLFAAAVLLVPVYRARNARWVELAELSERVLRTIAADAASQPTGHVVLVDAAGERFNLAAAFGNLLPEALELRIGRGWTGEIVSSIGEAEPATLLYALEKGQLVAKRRSGPGRGQ